MIKCSSLFTLFPRTTLFNRTSPFLSPLCSTFLFKLQQDIYTGSFFSIPITLLENILVFSRLIILVFYLVLLYNLLSIIYTLLLLLKLNVKNNFHSLIHVLKNLLLSRHLFMPIDPVFLKAWNNFWYDIIYSLRPSHG